MLHCLQTIISILSSIFEILVHQSAGDINWVGITCQTCHKDKQALRNKNTDVYND